MSRAERLLTLLVSLRTRGRFTVQEMADETGVSRRTMLRDLHALSALGVPLTASPGPGGGYALAFPHHMVPLLFTADEAIGLVLSYEAFLQHAQSPVAAPIASATQRPGQSQRQGYFLPYRRVIASIAAPWSRSSAQFRRCNRHSRR